MMHVAYVCSDLGVPIGGTKGASIHVRSLAQALAGRGHRVSLLAANPGGDPPAGFLPEIHPVGYDRTLKRIKRRIAEQDPDSSTGREFYALMLGNLVLRRLARLHEEQPLDAIYERHSLWSWAALNFARERQIPHILELNAPLVREQIAYRGLALRDVARACERELIAGSDAVVVPSRALAHHAVRLGATEESVHVLPNAVDPTDFTAVTERPAGSPPLDDKFVIAFAGSLKPWHGIEVLLEAFERFAAHNAQAHLLVLGDGPLRDRVDEAAASLGPERVTAPGAVSHREVPAWLHRADVGVAPYPPLEDFYFSPLKVVEYQASGLAVVASRIGHLQEQIDDGINGLLVEPGDPGELARALARLAGNPQWAERLGRQARRRVLASHTWPQVAGRVEALMRLHSKSPRLVLTSEAGS